MTMTNLFERLSKERPSLSSNKKAQKPPAQLLLDWLQRWPKPTVSPRDIRVYGPNSLRSRKNASDAAEVLVQNGWLAPVTTRRHSERAWRIIRKLIISPNVAA